MITLSKRAAKIAGMLLLLVWLVFSAGNFFAGAPQWGELTRKVKKERTLSGAVGVLETFTQEEVLLKHPMIEAYGVLQKVMGKRELSNFDLVRDRLGYLHSGNFYAGFGDDQRKIAINYRYLLDYCAAMGTKTGVIVTPMKTAPADARYPGIPYNSFLPEADKLLAWLRYYGVPCLDLTNLPEESGLGYEASFYKTDHHWTTPAAFYGYCRILDWLAGMEGAPLYHSGETRRLENYTVESDWLFGSQGRRAGLYYSGGTEPFSVYYPLEDGSYRMQAVEHGETTQYSGGFRGGLTYDQFGNSIRNDIFGSSSYDLYFLHGLHDLTQIENCGNPEGLRILLLCDSYSTPLGCFLAQNVGRLDLVYNLGGNQKDVLEMIRQNRYDYVLACLYPENLAIENCRLFENLDYA